MRYKSLVLKKLEAVENNINGLHSLLSRPDLTREQIEQWFLSVKEKLNEIETLINTEAES
jgi:hypothetical protein